MKTNSGTRGIKAGMVAGALGGTLLALCAGCGTGNNEGGGNGAQAGSSPEAPADAVAAPILEIAVEAGHSIGVYEPQPGALMMIERMQHGQTSILSQHQGIDAIQLYGLLRPDQTVPEVLIAATARARSVTAYPASNTADTGFQFGGGQHAVPVLTQSQSASADGTGVSRQAITSSSNPDDFVNSGGGCDWGSAASICRINWGGGFFASWNPSSSATCVVDHYAGNGITVQLTAGSTVIPTSQAVGTVQTYTWGLVSGAILRRMDILNASGDSFHAGCHFTK